MTITDGLHMTRLWYHLSFENDKKILREAVDFLIKQKLIVNKNTPTAQAIDREIELKEQERKERIAEYRRQKWIEQQNKLRAQRYYEKHKEEIVRQKIIKREKEIRKKSDFKMRQTITLMLKTKIMSRNQMQIKSKIQQPTKRRTDIWYRNFAETYKSF